MFPISDGSVLTDFKIYEEITWIPLVDLKDNSILGASLKIVLPWISIVGIYSRKQAREIKVNVNEPEINA